MFILKKEKRGRIMDFVGAIKAGFKNYANFRGVAGQSEYWYWYLFTVLAGIVLYAFDQFTNLNFLQTLFSAATLVPSTAVQVRRLRDAGHSWKWLLIQFGLSAALIVGIVGMIVRAVALIPGLNLNSDNTDPSLLQSQITVLAGDQAFVTFALVLLLSLVLTLVYLIVLLVLLVKPSKSFEQGNKYLAPSTPEN